MSCWRCEDCGTKNCDTETCMNPKCKSHNKEKKPHFVEIDSFPAIGDTFSQGIPDKITREF